MERTMTVITNTTLLIRRTGELRRRREALVDRLQQLRGSLPEWALAPLQLVGMSPDEIRSMMSDLSEAERASGLEEVERELEQLDQQIEELENLLLTTPARSLEAIHAVLDMAVTQFRAQTVTDPGDVFYDYGDARMPTFLERALEDMRTLLQESQRAAS
jgi:polyhydroxyalkanoate synthesis regulator phasin